jgi:sortase A
VRPNLFPVSTFRRVVDIFGRVLIGLGVLVLLFTAYQIWGTSVQEARVQSGLRTQLQKDTNSDAVKRALAQESALDKLPTGPPVAAPATTAPAEGEPIGDIRIPVIGLNQVVVEGTNTPDLRKGPGHYTGTPLPGQAGNSAVAGHRTTYGHPFYNLDSVKVGDPIVLTTLQGIFVYDATKSFVVSPSDTTVVDNVIANQLTLTTCNPRFSATTRLVVQAKLAHSQLFPNSGLPAQTQKNVHSDPKSESLAGDSGVSLGDALFWGFVTALLVTGIFFAAHYLRRQRWLIYGVGSVGALVLLWFFFGAVSPLLPASF